jgi:hypothetical protein
VEGRQVIDDRATAIWTEVTYRASHHVTNLLGPIPAELFEDAANEMRAHAADLQRRNYAHDAALAAIAADRLDENAELTRILAARTREPETALLTKATAA